MGVRRDQVFWLYGNPMLRCRNGAQWRNRMALQRFRAWLEDEPGATTAAAWHQAGPTLVASYLEFRARGGPTAAAGVLNTMAWWNKHVGTQWLVTATAVAA